MITVGNNNERRASQAIQVLPIVLGHRQRIDYHVTVGSHPEPAIEVQITFLIKLRPAEQIVSVK